MTRACGCGHGKAFHVHWRRGSDCGTCGADVCPVFQARRSWLGAALRRLRREVAR